MGGQSAVHENCLPETLQRSCQPQKFIADSPPKDRGQSACAGQNLPEAVSVGWQCKTFRGGRSTKGPRTVRYWTEWWGRPDLTYIGCPPHLPHQTEHILQKCLSLSLSSTWGRRQGQAFLEWFPDGPRASPDSSQDCVSCPLGISMNP